MTRAALGPREVEEPLELGPDRGDVRRERLAVEQVPLGRRARRVADHPGPAADERDRPAAVALELEQPEDRDEVADVERRPGRVEAVVAGDRPAGREPRRQARRRRRGASPASASSSSEARRGRRRPSSAASRRRRHRHARPSRLDRPDRGGSPRPLCYRAARHADQPRAAPAPSAQPRPRAASRLLRRPAESSSPSRSSSSPSSSWSAWSGLRRRSPPPTTTTARACPTREDTLSNLDVRPADASSPTGPARSSWPVSASSSARSSRSTRSRPRCSTRRPRSRTRTSGTNPGFDSAASSRRRSTPSAASPAAARRSPSSSSAPGSCPPSAFDGSREERKIREIIQSLRLTQAYPGRGRQAGDHHRLPEPELLRQPELRRRRRRPETYFGKDLKDLTLAQAAILAAIPQSPDDVRPRPRTPSEVCTRSVAGGRRLPGRQRPARRPGRRPRSSSAATTSST